MSKLTDKEIKEFMADNGIKVNELFLIKEKYRTCSITYKDDSYKLCYENVNEGTVYDNDMLYEIINNDINILNLKDL